MPRRISKSGGRFSSIKKRITSIPTSLKTKTYPRARIFIRRRPMASFFVALLVLLLVMILNSVLTPKPQETASRTAPREVSVYKVGEAPRVTFSAKVDKEGVIKIIAQAPGIVSQINVVEGQTVWRGNTLISLANNYVGGNAASVSRQLAQIQYQNVKDTYDVQKEIIGKQKEIANKTDQNADEMRAIADKSLNETNEVINLNNEMITAAQAALDAANTSGDPAAIAAARAQLVQLKSANLQLNQASRSAQLQAAADKPPAQLSDLAREMTIKQLEVQEKALDLSREVSRLQLVLAQIQESAMYPSAPFEGIIEKVHVTFGQSVSPGTPLITLSGTKKNATVSVNIPSALAAQVSKLEDSILHVSGKEYNVTPDYVSGEATDGLLNSVTYTLPDEAYEKAVDGGYIKVEIPIGYPDTIATIPYIPIDIVFQTQEGDFVYVIKDDKVSSRRISLGDVVGSNVSVLSGLSRRDQVILNRNVIEGESVKVTN